MRTLFAGVSSNPGNNLTAKANAIVRAYQRAIEAVGARLLYLPANSPDFNPIEQAFAKFKGTLRAESARTISDLWYTIQRAFRRFTSAECRRYLTAAGYDAYDLT